MYARPMRPHVLRFAVLMGAGLAGVLLAFLLYGIGGGDVHAPAGSGLSKLQSTAGRPLVPDVSFTAGSGQTVRLTDFRGRFVVLNMWATWCPPCVKELPSLARAQAALPAERIAIVAVDLEHNQPVETLEFLRAHGAGDLRVYVDRDLVLMRMFKAYGLPLTVIIDPEGREIARAFGPEEWDSPAALDYLRKLVTPADAQRVGTGTSPR